MEEVNIIQWIENWYLTHCDGAWEHTEGIRIETLDNPGWHVKINLNGTELQEIEYDSGLIENNEHDWFYINVKDEIFDAHGDPNKLYFILSKFKELVLQTKSNLEN